jgi:L-threonylcarbamoyladenylate synthase
MVDHKTEIESAVKALSLKDGVIVIPTDTTYGVICRLDQPDAIDRIYDLKGRDRSKPLIILGSDPNMLFLWATGDMTLALLLAERFWPGPLTIVLRATEQVPAGILAGGKTVGLRVPNHAASRAVLATLPRGSAASTSANLSGAGAPSRWQEVAEAIGEKADYIMPDCDEPPAGKESTVIDVSGHEPKILREGVLKKDEVFSIINEVVRR